MCRGAAPGPAVRDPRWRGGTESPEHQRTYGPAPPSGAAVPRAEPAPRRGRVPNPAEAGRAGRASRATRAPSAAGSAYTPRPAGTGRLATHSHSSLLGARGHGRRQARGLAGEGPDSRRAARRTSRMSPGAWTGRVDGRRASREARSDRSEGRCRAPEAGTEAQAGRGVGPGPRRDASRSRRASGRSRPRRYYLSKAFTEMFGFHSPGRARPAGGAAPEREGVLAGRRDVLPEGKGQAPAGEGGGGCRKGGEVLNLSRSSGTETPPRLGGRAEGFGPRS